MHYSPGGSVASGDDDFEVLAALDALFKLASSNDLTERLGEPAIQIRARAALAMALFMPHDEARRNLNTLIVSEDIPEEVRSVAAEAIGNWPNS